MPLYLLGFYSGIKNTIDFLFALLTDFTDFIDFPLVVYFYQLVYLLLTDVALMCCHISGFSVEAVILLVLLIIPFSVASTTPLSV